jgi:hypothetical protein
MFIGIVVENGKLTHVTQSSEEWGDCAREVKRYAEGSPMLDDLHEGFEAYTINVEEGVIDSYLTTGIGGLMFARVDFSST